MPDDDDSARDDDVGFSGADFPEWLTAGCLPLLLMAAVALTVVACRIGGQ